jgi:hypothetical protein
MYHRLQANPSFTQNIQVSGQKSRAQNGISIGKRMDAEMVWKINFLDCA